MPIISRVRLSVPAGSDAPSGNADSAIFRESSLITTTRRRRPTLVPTLRVGTRGKPPPDPCCGKADVKRAVVLSEDSPFSSGAGLRARRSSPRGLAFCATLSSNLRHGERLRRLPLSADRKMARGGATDPDGLGHP